MSTLRHIALGLLARREHSAAELRRKLGRHAVDEAEADAVVEALELEGWVDDRRFAESYVRSRAGRGFGPLRIDSELTARGVDAPLARMAVWEADESWEERAESARRKRFPGDPPVGRSEQGRQVRFLQYRGFTREQISRVLWRGPSD